MAEDGLSENFVEPCSSQAPSALGQIVFLSMRSAVHRRWSVGDIGANFMPPISLGQYQLYRAGDRIVAR